jgi:Predicted membrane protein (DUF2207) C-terminal domain
MLAVENTDAVPWLVAGAVVLALWFVLFAVVASTTMPKLPHPGPATMDYGPEPPAVANFLSNRWELTTSAIAATLVDLAARRHVAIEQIGGGDNLVRLRASGKDSLNEYEQQVLALVRSKAENGTVPAHELSLGYGDQAERWWKTFRASVIDHARELDLTRHRFSRAQQLLLAGTLVAPFAVAGVGFEVYGAAQRAAGKSFDTGGGFAFAGILWLAMLAVGRSRLRGWRDTPAGSNAAARWLGVADYLRANESFRDTPPGGVAIWDRLLAYGTALGVAFATAAALPIGPTRDDDGWSPQRGLWREVRIEYPRRFGYGDAPARAIAVSLAVLGAAAAALVWVARIVLPAVIDAVDELTKRENGPGRWIFALVIVVFGVPLSYLAAQIVRRLVILWRAVPDLGRTETFQGYVVRVPWHYQSDGDGGGRWERTGYIAVDDGSSDEVRAVKYADDGIREGQTVRVTLTPRMRHVTHMEVVPERVQN